jgi:hypothetical protein
VDSTSTRQHAKFAITGGTSAKPTAILSHYT